MKKITLLLLLISGITAGTYAQNFSKGTTHLSLGAGIGGYFSYSYIGDFSSTPTIFVAVDHGIIDALGPGNLGVGGFIGYKSSKYEYYSGFYNDIGKWTDFVIGARGNYHLILDNESLDVYGGLSLGLVFQSYTFESDDPFYTGYNFDTNSSFLYYALSVGGKYFFTENLGVFGELGYDVAWIKLGLTLNI